MEPANFGKFFDWERKLRSMIDMHKASESLPRPVTITTTNYDQVVFHLK
jgi:hypothetical protein